MDRYDKIKLNQNAFVISARQDNSIVTLSWTHTDKDRDKYHIFLTPEGGVRSSEFFDASDAVEPETCVGCTLNCEGPNEGIDCVFTTSNYYVGERTTGLIEGRYDIYIESYTENDKDKGTARTVMEFGR